MAPARTPQPRPAPSSPDADAAAPDAAARPDDADRAWAFLARRTAWERRLAELRHHAGLGAPETVGPSAPEQPAAATGWADRPEAA